MFLIWPMRCFFCCGDKQLWRVAEWLVRKRISVRKAVAGPGVVADPAAAVVQAAVVAAWAAGVLPAGRGAGARGGVGAAVPGGGAGDREAENKPVVVEVDVLAAAVVVRAVVVAAANR